MDGELVGKVTQQVIAMLRQRGVAVTATAPRPADRQVPAPVRQAAAVGKVFITADMLAQRLRAGGGAVELAANEFLTPGAVDLADQRHLTIRHSATPAAAAITQSPLSAQPAVPAGGAQACACNRIAVVTAGTNDTIRSVLSGLTRDGVAVVDMTKGDCAIADLERLCRAVATGEVARGAVIMPYAADAIVLANKTKGVRAVQGTKLESVAAALRHFAANVLVLEHALSTYHQMRSMLRLFATAPGSRSEALAAAIDKLEGA